MQTAKGETTITPSLLPVYQTLFAPVTRARLCRLLKIYLVLFSLGTVLLCFASSVQLQTFGLGLLFPSAGFLALAHHGFIWFIAVLSLFLFSLLLWFGTGNALAPPSVWFISALWASMNATAINPVVIYTVYGAIAWLVVLISCYLMWRSAVAKKQRLMDNAYLQTQTAFVAPSPETPPEMSLEALQRLRFALDRALQPLDEFNGFEWLDQFQSAAVRYQLNLLAYAIAMNQARYTPAFTGYAEQAQRNLLDKQRDYRVWSYWRLENLWGNLKYNPDPLSQDNIMYTGFIALQMALYQASTGNDEFSQTGRFRLEHPSGQHYAYHDASFIERLEQAYQTSDFFLIACEPNWIYPLCNSIGAAAILAYDPAKWQQHQASFKQYLDREFLDTKGRFVPCRSAYTGLALPAIGGIMPLALPCFFLNAIAPDIALRQWHLLRRQLFNQGQFQKNAFWRIDTGNYGRSRASAYAATALAAAELGDDDVYQQCLTAFEQECPSVLNTGVIHREHSSVWTHGVEIMARAVTQNSFQTMLLNPKKPTMRIARVNYPDVLVASAYIKDEVLHASLYAQQGKHDIQLAGLNAGQTYRICGITELNITADSQGSACVMLPLAEKTQIKVEQYQ